MTGPEVTDAAVEAFLVAYYGTPHYHENAKPLVRAALAAAAPELCREAWVYVTRVKDAEHRIATAERERLIALIVPVLDGYRNSNVSIDIRKRLDLPPAHVPDQERHH